ncbi:MAG: uncharacterized protein QOG15_3493 [Solirubrobacteraceae bacterium]|jgi:predicted enzyme related to lactoylglutathione lyase|nr:uncharacterized protein [Solirubrobacteraceae bacterium]
MPERTGYAQGTPCWVDVSSPDAPASTAFYADVFGWEHRSGGEETGGYVTFMKGGKSVAGLMPQMNPGQPIVWNTYLCADDADEVAANATEEGGQIVVEPMDVLDLGRMGFLVDPTGAFVGFWQPGTMRGAELVNETGTVGWNELATRDAGAAADFYEAVFGMQAAESDPAMGGPVDYRLWTVNGNTVGGLLPMGDRFPEEIPPHWMTYFVVEDTDATVAQAKAAGGGNPVAPFDSGVGRMAVLTDPFEAHFSVIVPHVPPAG